MFEHYEEKAWEFAKTMKRISPICLMRKYHLNIDIAKKLCSKIWLRQHLEGRKFAKEVED